MVWGVETPGVLRSQGVETPSIDGITAGTLQSGGIARAFCWCAATPRTRRTSSACCPSRASSCGGDVTPTRQGDSVLHGCYTGVTRVLHGCHTDVTRPYSCSPLLSSPRDTLPAHLSPASQGHMRGHHTHTLGTHVSAHPEMPSPRIFQRQGHPYEYVSPLFSSP